MSNSNHTIATGIILVIACLQFASTSGECLFLMNNFIGCNSIVCRLSALEQDVRQLKVQVARLPTGNNINHLNGANGNQQNNPFSNNQGLINPNQLNNNNNNNQGLLNQNPTTNDGNQPSNINQQAQVLNRRVNYAQPQYQDEYQNVQPTRRYQNSFQNNQQQGFFV